MKCLIGGSPSSGCDLSLISCISYQESQIEFVMFGRGALLTRSIGIPILASLFNSMSEIYHNFLDRIELVELY